MSDRFYYVAYPSSNLLTTEARLFINSMREMSPKNNVQALSKTLNLLANETLDAYLLDFCRSSTSNGMKKKLLNIADGTIKTTTRTVIRRVAKHLDIKQQMQVADHIDSCFLPIKGCHFQVSEMIACPLSQSQYQALNPGNKESIPRDIQHSRDVLMKRQNLMLELMVEYMIERLLSIIKLGPINYRIVRTAVDKCVRLFHSTIDKIVLSMDKDELENATKRIYKMLLII